MDAMGVRLHGANDLRLDRFDLPEIQSNEILADVKSNGICMSSHKATVQGSAHKRVPEDIAEHPILMGHEFCGNILKVGSAWEHEFKPGDKYGIQPALNIPGREHEAPGYSFRYIGGQATAIVIPAEVMERDCLLRYDGEAYFGGSLAESFSCIIGAFKTSYHYAHGTYEHINGIVEGGKMALLAGAGPMGLATIDYAIHGPMKPGTLVVTDIDQARLDRAASVLTVDDAGKQGVELVYLNTGGDEGEARLKSITDDAGYDDVFVFAPVTPLIEQASRILGLNGCLNFFAGPSEIDFLAEINFYDVHYMQHHVVGSSGGNTDDMREALQLMGEGRINPAVMITHIGGLDSAPETIQKLPSVPGGRKLIYTQVSMPLIALDDFPELGKSDPFFAELSRFTAANNGLWSVEAETYILENAKSILQV